MPQLSKTVTARDLHTLTLGFVLFYCCSTSAALCLHIRKKKYLTLLWPDFEKFIMTAFKISAPILGQINLKLQISKKKQTDPSKKSIHDHTHKKIT